MGWIAFLVFSVFAVLAIISESIRKKTEEAEKKRRAEEALLRKQREYEENCQKLEAERQAKIDAWQQEYDLRACEERLIYDALPKADIVLSTEKRLMGKYQNLTYSSVTAKTKKPADFVAIDTETTGLHTGNDRIIELAAVRFINGQPANTFHTYINPGKHIPEQATEINNITDDMVANAPKIAYVLDSFEAFVGSSDIVGHNLDFDMAFLFHAGSTLHETKRKYYDTLSLTQKVLKKAKYATSKYTGERYVRDDVDYDVLDYKLNTVAYHYGIANPDQHSALADAYVCGKMFIMLFEERQALLIAKREEKLENE